MTQNHLPATITGGGTGEQPTERGANAFGFGRGWGGTRIQWPLR